jgi:hypothetical protein
LCLCGQGVSWLLNGKRGPIPLFTRFYSSGFLYGDFSKTHCLLWKVQYVNELCDWKVRAPECITNEMLANIWWESEYCLGNSIWKTLWGPLFEDVSVSAINLMVEDI